MRDSTRIPDVILSATGLIVLSPVFLAIACIIKLKSKGKVFFTQQRVGLNNKEFTIYKFRTMIPDNNPGSSLLTVGSNNHRNTNTGAFLRKYKLDELPQLLNVLIGNMSIVGPRPEVRKYVNHYTAEQMKVLSIKPGITDWASIKYKNENDLLATAKDPEHYYISTIMPAKLALNKQYLEKRDLQNYFLIILKTIAAIKRTRFK